MIFTVLSGDASSSRPKPFAYVLQIDDTKVLLDCGSPEWCPESPEDPDTDWTGYCSALERSSPPSRHSTQIIVSHPAKLGP